MKVNKHISLIIISIIILSSINSCKVHRDCKGRKKTVKTAMGGWL